MNSSESLSRSVRSYGWMLGGVIGAVFTARVYSHFEYTPDDTFIYLQYARNLISSGEIAFNPGEPSYGVTSPLWLFLIAVPGWLGADLYSAAKLLDAVCALAALFVAIRVFQRAYASEPVALAAGAVLSTHVWFLRWAGSGMETSLVVLLTLVTVDMLARGRTVTGAVSSALLTLVRPEAGVLVALSVCALVLVRPLRPPRPRSLAVFLAVYASVLLPWYVYAAQQFGTLVPTTALAKSAASLTFEGGIAILTDIVLTMAPSDGLALCAGTLCMFLILMGKKGGGPEATSFVVQTDRWKTEYLIPLLWIAGLVVLYVVTSANVVSRYLVLLAPPAVFFCFGMVYNYAAWRFGRRGGILASLLVAGVIVVQHTIVFEAIVRPHQRAFAAGMREGFVTIGKWLHEHADPGASVLASDVGAIGYFSRLRVCDAAGLVSPELLEFSRRGYSIERMMQEPAYAERCNATFVVQRSSVPRPVHAGHLQPVLTTAIAGLGVADRDTVYYTVYKIIHR